HHRVLWAVVLSVALVVVFLTGSRAGLAAFVLFFALTAVAERSAKALLMLVIAAPLVIAGLLAVELDFDEMLERQVTLLEGPTTETLSTRDLIWQCRLEFLDQDKV